MNSFEDVFLFPNVYETQNLGLTFEVDPTVGEDDSVYLNFAPERVQYEGEIPPAVDPRAGGVEGDIIWPEFFVQKVTGGLEADPGQWVLVGTETSMRHRDTHQTLVFIRPLLHYFELPNGEATNGVPDILNFEWIETSHEQLNEWLADEDTSAMIGGGMRIAAEKAIEAGQAKIVEKRMIRFQHGQRVKNESITEIRYPTEFDPPKGEQFSSPTAVETRNVGVSVEADVVLIGSGKGADINVAPEIVSYFGQSVHHRREIAGEFVPDVTMPIFYAMHPTTTVAAPVDVPILMSVMTPPDAMGNPDAGRKVLLFVKVTR
jgi:hypothetical protein